MSLLSYCWDVLVLFSALLQQLHWKPFFLYIFESPQAGSLFSLALWMNLLNQFVFFFSNLLTMYFSGDIVLLMERVCFLVRFDE